MHLHHFHSGHIETHLEVVSPIISGLFRMAQHRHAATRRVSGMSTRKHPQCCFGLHHPDYAR